MIILIFVMLFANSIQARNCSINNGDCDHYCIDRNDGDDAFCGCRCHFSLDSDNQTCSVSESCTVDMLWIYDFSDDILPGLDCFFLTRGGNVDRTPFEEWRNITATYIEAFAAEISDGTYQIATMISGEEFKVKNNFGELQDAAALRGQIEELPTDENGICGVSEIIFRNLYYISDGTVSGPEGGGDASTTTRVAIVTMVTPLPAADEATELIPYSNIIHSYFDTVIVIGKNDTSLLSDSDADQIDFQYRYLACSDGREPFCDYLFYVDSANDNGATFSLPAVQPLINADACVTRKSLPEHSVSCGLADATITIPLCLLGGLEAKDLLLNNNSCDVPTLSVVSGTDLLITVNYNDCSWSMVVVGDNVEFTQTVTRVDFGIENSAKSINIEATCVFPNYNEEELGGVDVVIEDAITGIVTAQGTFDIEYRLYTDGSYSTVYSPLPSSIPVFQRLYMAAEASIPSNFKLILVDFFASTSSDGTSGQIYYILTNLCVNDTTFQYESSDVDETKRFSVQMFEFSSTASQPNGLKAAVYFFVNVRVCEDTDTTAKCTQACPSRRKKRDLSDDEDLQSHRMGPFYFGDAAVDDVKIDHNNPKSLNDHKNPSRPIEDKNRAGSFNYLHPPIPVNQKDAPSLVNHEDPPNPVELTLVVDSSRFEMTGYLWMLFTAFNITIVFIVTNCLCKRKEDREMAKLSLSGVDSKTVVDSTKICANSTKS